MTSHNTSLAAFNAGSSPSAPSDPFLDSSRVRRKLDEDELDAAAPAGELLLLDELEEALPNTESRLSFLPGLLALFLLSSSN